MLRRLRCAIQVDQLQAPEMLTPGEHARGSPEFYAAAAHVASYRRDPKFITYLDYLESIIVIHSGGQTEIEMKFAKQYAGYLQGRLICRAKEFSSIACDIHDLVKARLLLAPLPLASALAPAAAPPAAAVLGPIAPMVAPADGPGRPHAAAGQLERAGRDAVLAQSRSRRRSRSRSRSHSPSRGHSHRHNRGRSPPARSPTAEAGPGCNHCNNLAASVQALLKTMQEQQAAAHLKEQARDPMLKPPGAAATAGELMMQQGSHGIAAAAVNSIPLDPGGEAHEQRSESVITQNTSEASGDLQAEQQQQEDMAGWMREPDRARGGPKTWNNDERPYMHQHAFAATLTDLATGAHLHAQLQDPADAVGGHSMGDLQHSSSTHAAAAVSRPLAPQQQPSSAADGAARNVTTESTQEEEPPAVTAREVLAGVLRLAILAVWSHVVRSALADVFRQF